MWWQNTYTLGRPPTIPHKPGAGEKQYEPITTNINMLQKSLK